MASRASNLAFSLLKIHWKSQVSFVTCSASLVTQAPIVAIIGRTGLWDTLCFYFGLWDTLWFQNRWVYCFLAFVKVA